MSLKQRLGFSQEPLYIMDGAAFIYRGFFANANMSRSDGFPTGALYIVGRILMKLLKEEKPTHFAFIMDGKGANFRHEIFPAYKANREAAPEDLIRQIKPVLDMVQALGLHVEVSHNCEGDDCLAALAYRHKKERPVVIVGVDKDLRQCLDNNVFLWDPAAKEEKLVSLESFQADSGLRPEQWPDVQALIGDSSDNIPGVRGIGEKTAFKLMQEFPNLEALSQGYDSLSPTLKKKFEGQLEAMFLYRRLTTLDVQACPHVSLDDMAVRPLRKGGLEALTLLKEFEMGSLHRDLDTLIRKGLVSVQDAGTTMEDEAKSAPNHGKGQQQLNLLDFVKPASQENSTQVSPTKEFQAVVIPRQKPKTWSDKIVALVPEGRIANAWVHVAQMEAGQDPNSAQECMCRMEEIFPAALEAESIITPDAKYLLHQALQLAHLTPVQKQRLIQHSATWQDLGLAAYLLAPEDRDYGWPRLSARHVAASGINPVLAGTLALSLYQESLKSMQEQGLGELYENLELPLVPVLTHMENAGIGLDLQALQDFLVEVQSQLDTLTAKIYQEAGSTFNIRSAQQIGEILFKQMGLQVGKNTKGGQASTSQDVLEKLAGHPVVDALLEFRKLEKLRSTYLEPLPKLCGADGRIRTTLNQSATATGRLSSSNPNLQNIPIRGDLGKRMRTCFTAKPGHVLISADYSQIELRVLAHYTQDPTLLAAFRNGEDIHTRTAALLNDLPLEAIVPDQRRNAKTINFGLIYGMGARKLSQELHISLTEAKEFMERYFARFSHIKDFYDQVEEAARNQGYVTTLSGRRRPLPDMQAKNQQVRALAERQAVNTLIQGSAADIIKLAMLDVFHSPRLAALSANLLLQVHDELIVEVAEAQAHEAGTLVAEIMSAVQPSGPLAVPLLVDWGAGPNWGAAH